MRHIATGQEIPGRGQARSTPPLRCSALHAPRYLISSFLFLTAALGKSRAALLSQRSGIFPVEHVERSGADVENLSLGETDRRRNFALRPVCGTRLGGARGSDGGQQSHSGNAQRQTGISAAPGITFLTGHWDSSCRGVFNATKLTGKRASLLTKINCGPVRHIPDEQENRGSARRCGSDVGIRRAARRRCACRLRRRSWPPTPRSRRRSWSCRAAAR